MKQTILILVLITSQIIFAQNGEIEYKVIFKKESDDNSEFGKKLVKELLLMSFSLRYSSDESFFEKLVNVPIDPFSAKMATVTANATEYWYQRPITKKAFYNKDIAGTKYLIQHDYRMKDWQLSNEKKQIEQYTCYKATLKLFNERNSLYYIVEAWYTPDISLPYGPIGFGGLPGLILELKHKQTIFIANKITLNAKNKIKSYPEANMDRPINTDEMVRLMRKSRKVTDD